MTTKFFALFALVASGLTCLAQTNSPDVHGANTPAASSPPAAVTADGRTLFLKNCAHCHGSSAHGDEGPDLHNLDWTDKMIDTRIRKGKKGQMTAFEGKLTPEQITTVIAYLRTLK
jgi:mono/diheme cytochrome c family protein